ncbi:MAG: glycosyltransferase [Candidatus Levybacteria bacterium]|nr:glycosyltransferase [Candidatus Levybacteria bacterium]
MKKISFENLKAIVVIHEFTSGLGHDLRDYILAHKVEELLFIAHPLLYIPQNYKNSSRFELYKKGKLLKTGKALHWNLPEPLLYVKDFLYTLFWSVRFIGKSNLFFGVGNLNAFAGLVLRFFYLAGSVTYYVIDYVPIRFQNKLLNNIYHWIEKISAKYSSWTWNLSPRMIEARNNKWNEKFNNQLIVPHGLDYDRIKRVSFEKINKYEILYMGSLLKKQGIQLVIEILPDLIKEIPSVRFTIIGTGPYNVELKRLVKKLSLESYVSFLGYIASHAEMEERVAKAAIAIALYNKEYDDFSYFADPGKVKSYLGAGVPIIITDVPFIARQVNDKKCGFIINYDKNDLYKILIKYFKDEKLMKEYRENAVEFAKQYDWDKLFTGVFSKILNALENLQKI